MSVVGLGTDIIEIARLGDDPKRLNKLAQRILTESELVTYSASSQPVRFLAKRFAAKEATVKALGTGIGNGVSWQHIEISNNALGAPELQLTEGALRQAEAMHASQFAISIADEQHYAVATVILSRV
ncbi:holo-ACP synthase [Alteromonas sediminis]|uniref:Holo-[acyl-carrier-protein] synthase n=1 Tax=Alteromonas sediminis TaxID=2259342 RepID=A0A3N5Y600_9ALTE|nr:holo-ACP synthase [Alteromonas sediminis]RPJ65749.1 holo-ACP synthase [Alteromonas sediminis]